MGQPIIQVEKLCKQYRLGSSAPYHRISDVVLGAATLSLRAAASLWRKPVAEDSPSHFWALKDVSFDVQPGEVLGVIGRNGAGKSTLLKILSRITEPTSGRVVMRGRVGSLLEVGTGFHPELSGRENIYLSGAVLGMRTAEIKHKFDEIVAFAEVEKFLDTPVKHYSSGMYMRLAFAVAAHLDPEILLIDEVLAVGDAQFQKKCLGKMSEVAQGGRTVLFVSHNMNAIKSLCGQALLLKDGTSVKHGAADLVVKYYLSNDESQTRWDRTDSTTSRMINPFFTPFAFWLIDAEGQPIRSTVGADTRVGVVMEGELHSIHPAMTIGFSVSTTSGDLMFWSLATDKSSDKWPVLKRGINRLVGWIPSHLLNEGEYTVSMIVSLHYMQWLIEPGRNSPEIRLSIRGGLSESPFWIAARPGLNAPVLDFELLPTSQLELRDTKG